MDAYLKDQFDFTGVKAALLVSKVFWSFSEIINQIFLGQIHGSCQVVEEKVKKRLLNVFNVRSGRSWA